MDGLWPVLRLVLSPALVQKAAQLVGCRHSSTTFRPHPWQYVGLSKSKSTASHSLHLKLPVVLTFLHVPRPTVAETACSGVRVFHASIASALV
jgi:hypothetical protein